MARKSNRRWQGFGSQATPTKTFGAGMPIADSQKRTLTKLRNKAGRLLDDINNMTRGKAYGEIKEIELLLGPSKGESKKQRKRSKAETSIKKSERKAEKHLQMRREEG